LTPEGGFLSRFLAGRSSEARQGPARRGSGGFFQVAQAKEDMEMTSFDFPTLLRSTIGFDRLDEIMDFALQANDSYPPYNIELTGDDKYRVTLAVAGFEPDELVVTQRENMLIVGGARKQDEKEQKEVLWQGIAARPFQHRFQLADHVKVVGASLVNGLLTIDLARELPEEMKPRTIQIESGDGSRKQIGKAA
jgi:molecular chaperone IbpA